MTLVKNYKPDRETILKFESELKKLPQLDVETIHHFAPGIYAREIRIKAGTVLTGAIHKTEHLNMLSAGTIRVNTDNGVEELTAPYTFISSPGTKRIGLAITDCVWTTIHPNIDDTKDLSMIESQVVELPQIEEDVDK